MNISCCYQWQPDMLEHLLFIKQLHTNSSNGSRTLISTDLYISVKMEAAKSNNVKSNKVKEYCEVNQNYYEGDCECLSCTCTFIQGCKPCTESRAISQEVSSPKIIQVFIQRHVVGWNMFGQVGIVWPRKGRKSVRKKN